MEMRDLGTLYFLAVIPIAWCVLLWLFSRLSGWTRLAQTYRAGEVEVDESAWLRTGRIGAISYHSCLCLGVNDQGLRIAVAFPMRLFHPPLFIPWDQFRQVAADSKLYSHRCRMSVGRPTVVSMMMPGWVRYRLPLEMRPEG